MRASDALDEIQAGTNITAWARMRKYKLSDLSREYASFHAFVASVVDDDVRQELVEFAYPLFVKCYFAVAQHQFVKEFRLHLKEHEVVDHAHFFALFAPLFAPAHSDELGAVLACRTTESASFSSVYVKYTRDAIPVFISVPSLSVALGFLYNTCSYTLLTKMYELRIRTTATMPCACSDQHLRANDVLLKSLAAYIAHKGGPLSLAVPADLAVLSVAAANQLCAAEQDSAESDKKRVRRRKQHSVAADAEPDADNTENDAEDDDGAASAAGGVATPLPSASPLLGPRGDSLAGFGAAGDTVDLYEGDDKYRRKRLVLPPRLHHFIANERAIAKATPLGVIAQAPPPQTQAQAAAAAAATAQAAGVKRTVVRIPSVSFSTVHDQSESVTCMSISPQGGTVFSGHSTGAINVWALSSASQPTDNFLPHAARPLVGHGGAVTDVAPTLDAQYVLSSSVDSTARLWCVNTGSELVKFVAHAPNQPLWAISSSPAGEYFVTCSRDTTARLFTTSFPHPVRVFYGHSRDVTAAAFHPTCAYVATGSDDRTVRLWDIGTGRTVRRFVAQGAPISSVCCSPDGRYVAAGSLRGDISVWDIATGAIALRLAGHGDRRTGRAAPVDALSFSTDGAVLASGSCDQTVRVWDTGAEALEAAAAASAARVAADTEDLGTLRPVSDGGCLAVFGTRSTPVHTVRFARTNLLLAAGPMLESLV